MRPATAITVVKPRRLLTPALLTVFPWSSHADLIRNAAMMMQSAFTPAVLSLPTLICARTAATATAIQERPALNAVMTAADALARASLCIPTISLFTSEEKP